MIRWIWLVFAILSLSLGWDASRTVVSRETACQSQSADEDKQSGRSVSFDRDEDDDDDFNVAGHGIEARVFHPERVIERRVDTVQRGPLPEPSTPPPRA